MLDNSGKDILGIFLRLSKRPNAPDTTKRQRGPQAPSWMSPGSHSWQAVNASI